MDKKTVLWLGAGCVVVCVMLGIALLVLGGAFVNWAMEEPENITVDMTLPVEVAKGDEFVMEVQVTNSANEPQELNSIDIDVSYLDGVIINRTEPIYSDFSEIEFVKSFHSYFFGNDIPANSSFIVKFYMTALKPGDFSGSVDVCINSEVECLEYFARTIIHE
ncbi:MAG: hypothetical protein B6I38_10325 [Anaerolineaceae bacterium 4572_5.1]|nr:MAG: hypothetical protein B6I38_10325 [Anaerolineaceae bacterium 4572_5.1]